ncbi:hypothetical protein Syun_008493 [Stephania yunnanensis]|uniref:Mitotic checkpoint serine/threonine-protein kinase BUB1 n=1 Tax=Stephania yunnanensis TaxID=152371 RepID=A0AAP0KEP0_9MAGN
MIIKFTFVSQDDYISINIYSIIDTTENRERERERERTMALNQRRLRRLRLRLGPPRQTLRGLRHEVQGLRRYRDDLRFLKIWLLYADAIQDFRTVFAIMQEERICVSFALLYISYALFLEAKGKFVEADGIYQMGVSRNAQPIGELKRFHAEFRGRMSQFVNLSQLGEIDKKESTDVEKNCVNPWAASTMDDMLTKISPLMLKYNGYHKSSKSYSGKVSLASLKSSARNKVIDIGGQKYQIKGCSGQGAFAQVFKAYVDSNPDEVVALKIQKPPFPWEFYMYFQLDKRISDSERSSFAFAHRIHLFSDYSILVCDYLAHGTLQDAINAYVVVGANMEEILCIYYTIQMLHMLETLHSVGIIHGDLKPDNLLMRYARVDLSEDGFLGQTGAWRDQGLCLIDWGRGIDLSLFPDNIVFRGDCRTSGFRCVEMQEHRPWRFQASTGMLIYGGISSQDCSTLVPSSQSKHINTYTLLVLGCMIENVEEMEITIRQVSYMLSRLPRSSFVNLWRFNLDKNFASVILCSSHTHTQVAAERDKKKSLQKFLRFSLQLIKKNSSLFVKLCGSMCLS